MLSRMGSLTPDEVISFTVSNYDADLEDREKTNSWVSRLVTGNTRVKTHPASSRREVS